MKTITNNHWRNFLYGYELTDKEIAEYDHLDTDEKTDGFIRYRGIVYHVSDFLRSIDDKVWQGYFGQTVFSAVVIQISDDGEQYKIGLSLS